MAKLTWDDPGKHYYETGISQGVLYVYDEDDKEYTKDVTAWNGLTAVTEAPSGAEETALYADDIKYLSLRSAEDFGLTLEAYTYPDAWGQCDGSASLATGVVVGQQSRVMFGLAYKTIVGNDVSGNNKGYKLHLIYGATASPSERAYQTVNDSPEAITFSWEITTTPANVVPTDTSVNLKLKPVSIITIDSITADPDFLAELEGKLFGTTDEDPYLPLPGEVYDIFNQTKPTPPPGNGEEENPVG